jgi:tagaturonate reductase
LRLPNTWANREPAEELHPVMSALPETVLQFGSGKFLRGFADFFIHEANRDGRNVGRIVVVQTTGNSRADLLNQQGGRFHVLIRGLENGQVVDRVELVQSVSRALVAAQQWDAVVSMARAPELRIILSNTAEVGYTLDPADQQSDRPPRSFPAKLLLVLKERYQAGQPGVTILPCELFEHNADLLLGLLIQLAQAWGLPIGLEHWLRTQCVWHNTLVDRIVSAQPAEHPLLANDALLTVAEPFAFWAIETKTGDGAPFHHPAIKTTTDVMPYFLRKVRILNAAHTALVTKAVPRRFTTVRQAVSEPEIAAWLNRLLFDEILPVLQGRVEEPEKFARQTLERLRNPFLEHKLSDIMAYHDTKAKLRLLPTREEFVQKFGRNPPLLDEAMAASARM